MSLNDKIYAALRNPAITMDELKPLLLDVTLQLDYLDAREPYIVRLESHLATIESLFNELLEKIALC